MAEDDAELARIVHGMREHAGRFGGEHIQVLHSVKIIPVEDEQPVALRVGLAGEQGVAGPARHRLTDAHPVLDVRLSRQVGLDLLREIVRDHDQPGHLRGQCGYRPVEDRPALDFEKRFGGFERVRSEPGAKAGSQYDGVHEKSPLVACGSICSVYQLDPIIREKWIMQGERVCRNE